MTVGRESTHVSLFAGEQCMTDREGSAPRAPAGHVDLRARPAASPTCCATSCPRWPTHTVAAIIDEVPELRRRARAGRWARTSSNAVQMALGGFLTLAARGRAERPGHAARPGARGRLRSSAAARRAAAAPSTRCSRPTGSAPGWPGASCPRPRWRSGRRRPRRWPRSPSWSSPTSTSCRRPASPATPTSWRRTGRVRQRYLERLARALLAGATRPTRCRRRRRARRLDAAARR